MKIFDPFFELPDDQFMALGVTEIKRIAKARILCMSVVAIVILITFAGTSIGLYLTR